MHSGKLVFAQLMEFFSRHDFDKCVRRYRGNYRTRDFSCRDQFLAMAFAQLTYRESLRDIEICLRSVQPKLYHMGFRGRIARSTLADANRKRDWRIYADFAQTLIQRAKTLSRRAVRSRSGRDGLCSRFDDHRSVSLAVSLGHVSTPKGSRQASHVARSTRQYPLFSSRFARKNARRKHPGRTADRTGRVLHHGQGAHRLCASVPAAPASRILPDTRQKNLDAKRRESRIIDKATGLRSDQTIVLAGVKSSQAYPEALRRIHYFDIKTGKRFVFLTNNFVLPALVIAQLYKCRWQIELFFKWIKQHLRIKAFYGTSPGAVRTQIWIAISVYVLVAIVKKELKIERSLSEILQILSVNPFETTPVLQLLTNPTNRFPDTTFPK